jgi:signal transduction histidine kinase
MTPAARLRFRRLTVALAAAWGFAGLLAFLDAVVLSTGYVPPFDTANAAGHMTVSWVTREAKLSGIRQGDRILEIDGEPALRWYRETRWREMKAGRPNHYALEHREGSRYELDLAPVPASAEPALGVPVNAATLLVGSTYLALGLLVWMLRRGRDESWAFSLFCSAMAAQLFTSFETFRQLLGYERTLLSLSFVGAATFQLFTTYPFAPAWVERRPWLRPLVWTVAALSVPLLLLESLLPIPPLVIQTGAFFFAIGISLFSIGALAVERRRRRADEDADRADVMLIGAFVSFVPVLLLLIVEIFLQAGLPVYLALLWFVVFPISVAYGIVRKQLFDIRHLARSSVAYGAATLAITGLYAFLIASADALVKRFDVNALSPRFSLIFLFFAVLAFNPIRSRVQGLVDRLFDREQGRYRQTVREISEAMVSMLSIKEIVERIVRALTEAMGVERSMVLLLAEDDRTLRPEAVGGDWRIDVGSFALPMDHPLCKYLWMRREEVSRKDVDEEPDPALRAVCLEVFERLDVALLVPVLFGVDLLGVIAVGRKASGDRVSPDDRQLLLTLANQSSIAIENAKAFDEIAKLNETLEARVDERTRELRDTQNLLLQSEKMRTLGQLVAGVAHELNNPIGFVHANLKLLEEYVDKLAAAQQAGGDTARPREAIAKLLARSREGTDRVKKIVADLRTFSRMDQAELQEADLNAEIDRTLTLMEPRCKNCIQVERDFGELPRVRCHAGQLNQVFMNLLMNACDARGRICVRTRSADGRVRLEFEDDGPGIPEAVRDRVFEPFFTTKPVGQGTGLGLSLSHGIVERHGGRIWCESETGAGTRFVIELPVAPVSA